MIEAYLGCLDLAYFEVTEAFKGLGDEHVWKRPAEGLLSVGELAGHIAHWEAVRLAGEGGKPWPDIAKCRVRSPLIDPRFRYYPITLANPPSEQHRTMTAEQVCRELLRVHEEAVAHFRALNPDPESTPPGWAPFWTYGESLKYAVFHVSYHTGQIYSARHLLGEETPDN
jgi:DinB superfamily